jgi:hypothetical protein
LRIAAVLWIISGVVRYSQLVITASIQVQGNAHT